MKNDERTKDKIIELLLSNREGITRFGTKRIGLFGSYVRGEQTEASDIDFLVEFVPGQKTYDNFIHLAYFLEELLGKEVELITSDSLSSYLKPYIEKEVEFVSFAS